MNLADIIAFVIVAAIVAPWTIGMVVLMWANVVTNGQHNGS